MAEPELQHKDTRARTFLGQGHWISYLCMLAFVLKLFAIWDVNRKQWRDEAESRGVWLQVIITHSNQLLPCIWGLVNAPQKNECGLSKEVKDLEGEKEKCLAETLKEWMCLFFSRWEQIWTTKGWRDVIQEGEDASKAHSSSRSSSGFNFYLSQWAVSQQLLKTAAWLWGFLYLLSEIQQCVLAF